MTVDVKINDVWSHNLDKEFERIRTLIEEYPYVAMDTEFPGVVATPLGQFKSKEDFNYQQVSCNVNMLKLIQVGFALMNENGELPPGGDVWQFNFHFSLTSDMYSQESVDLLRNAGIDFERHQSDGIRMNDFGEYLTTSGLVVDEKVTWITFHSGYDFGYLIRSIMLCDLPNNEESFFKFHRSLFPSSYDIKMITKMPGILSTQFHGGLQEIADQLQVKRNGTQHQAGSDSLLTAQTFFRIKELFFSENWDQVAPRVNGLLYGLGSSLSHSNAPVYPMYPRMTTPSPHPQLSRARDRDDSTGSPNTTRGTIMPNNRANKGRKRKGKDIDQIHEDLKPEKAAKLQNQEVDYDLPGNGQHYCIECNRYFEDEKAVSTHKKTKVHKYRLKQLKEKPYSQKEADAAGGLGLL